MKVRSTMTAQGLSVDEAYERFFDGFYNLGKPGDIFERTMVVSVPPPPAPARPRTARALRSGRTRRVRRY